MAKVTKMVGKNSFFEFKRDFWLMLGAGMVFGLSLTFLPTVLDGLFCHIVTPICLSDGAKNYQITLILSGLLAVICLLGFKIDRSLFAVLPSLMVFWFFTANQSDWLVRLLINLALSALLFGLFAWVAQIKDWRVALVIDLALTVILILFVR